MEKISEMISTREESIEEEEEESAPALNVIINKGTSAGGANTNYYIAVLFGDDENYFETFDEWFRV
jgi:hypothetical protein